MILENFSRATNGSTFVRNNVNPNGFTQSHPNTTTERRREGTGRRKKPIIPDETSYSFRELKIIAPRGTGSWQNATKSNWNEWSGSLPQFLTTNLSSGLQLPSALDPSLRDRALIGCLSEMNFRDLDLGTAWAERGKTADLVGDIATKTIETIRAARRRRGREILDIWGLRHEGARGKGVVDTYLTYHYGVKPAAQDLSGAVQALTRLPQGEWKIAKKDAASYETHQSTQVGLGSFYPYECSSFMRQSCRARVSAHQRPLTRQEDLVWALGLDAPLSTAWELTPFSFMIDWMTPIGDWLQALNSLKYYDGWQVCTTQYRKETCVYTGSSGTVSGIKCSTTLSGGHYERVDILRSVSNGPPLIRLPVKDPRSVDHMAKTLALLASTFAYGGIPPTVRY